MPPPYRYHVFVCTNRRPDGSPKGCCASKGSEALLATFKEEVSNAGLRGVVRAQASGCLDACERGMTVAVYGELSPLAGHWYGKVTAGDVPEIVTQHLQQGHPVERLAMEPYPPKKG
ncbi:MAG: (2Fe-2S) ferredoxin domain-containing protein [Myxococcota bacterium]|nr:(2Fe-2S) ferredoxin domain-containing protein [Myxococcota bacterium]